MRAPISALEKLIVDSCLLPAYDFPLRHFAERKIIHTLTLKLNADEPVTLHGKRVIKARLIFTTRDADSQDKPFDYQASETGVWQFTFADKTKSTQAANNDSIPNCVTELKKRGATHRHFDQRMTGGADLQYRNNERGLRRKSSL
jgi:hypothetical protein